MSTVNQEFYLTLSPRTIACYGKGEVIGMNIPKITKNAPNLNRNEICMKLNIDVPVSLFLKPSLEASITVPPDCISPVIITPEIQDNIKDIIKQNTDLDLNITVVGQEPK